MLSLCCLIALSVACILFIARNGTDYLANDVVTQIKVVESEDLSMTFPAITFCLIQFLPTESLLEMNLISHKLGVIKQCFFDFENICSFEDFESIPIYASPTDQTLDCYKFNGGKSGPKLSTAKAGITSGLTIAFDLPNDTFLYYIVADNKVNPIWTEFINQSDQKDGLQVNVNIQKTVDVKLPEPYSPCIDNINSQTSYLVQQIIEQNMTYRKKDCYELCFQKYLKAYAKTQNMTIRVAYNSLRFDYKGNCSQICPLECTAELFAVSTTEFKSVNRFLTLLFFYSDRKYTRISQTVKTTLADFVSNTGGVLGLFLEISFLSFYRLFDNFFLR